MILTFGLGIGGNAAVFSVMNAVVLRFLPVYDPDRLVFLHTSRQPDGASQTGLDGTSLSFQMYQQLSAERAAFAELDDVRPAGHRPGCRAVGRSDDRAAQRVGRRPLGARSASQLAATMRRRSHGPARREPRERRDVPVNLIVILGKSDGKPGDDTDYAWRPPGV